MRKGQGAMEYLMTYGWAILVVVIVGIVLWRSGIFGMVTCSTTGFTNIRVDDYVFKSTNPSTVVWANAVGRPVKQLNMTYSGDCVATGAAVTNNIVTLAGGQTLSQNINCSTPCTAGTAYTVNVGISYVSEAGITHSESGTIRCTCA